MLNFCFLLAHDHRCRQNVLSLILLDEYYLPIIISKKECANDDWWIMGQEWHWYLLNIYLGMRAHGPITRALTFGITYHDFYFISKEV